jgi:hypothetical protein
MLSAQVLLLVSHCTLVQSLCNSGALLTCLVALFADAAAGLHAWRDPVLQCCIDVVHCCFVWRSGSNPLLLLSAQRCLSG